MDSRDQRQRREALGLHRVIEPEGVLPQVAQVLDSTPARKSAGELLIEVETLNIDSASMLQLEQSCGGDAERVGDHIADIVAERGKMQNPVTGSGGMLLGRVRSTGNVLGDRFGVADGDRVATLVSLTLTPLHLQCIREVRLQSHQVDVDGTAVVFPSGCLTALPTDLSEAVALALLDVAGAAPQVLRLARPGGSVCILGAGGKSGLLCAAAARERVGDDGVVVGVEAVNPAADAARRIGAYTAVEVANAADPVAVVEAAGPHGPMAGFDLVVSCVNAPGAEMGAILLARERGCVYFFSMATSFARAALGAEGVTRDVDLMIGNGFCADHAVATLELYRRHAALRAELESRFE